MNTLTNNNNNSNDLLIKHLDKIGNYDLERLKACFQSEYEHDVANRESTADIISHIDSILAKRKEEGTK